MAIQVKVIGLGEAEAVAELIRASVRGLQVEDYSEAAREAALRSVFTVDTRLLADGTYFGAFYPQNDGEERLVGCGGWSGRKTLYGGDHQVEHSASDAEWMNPAVDAAKIRAIFVHPEWARRGIGGMLLYAAEGAAVEAGFRRFEMGSTLTGLKMYGREGYREVDRRMVPVGDGEAIEVVRMVKEANVGR